MKGMLIFVADYKCRKCTNELKPIEGRSAESVAVNNESLSVVNKW